MFFVVREDSPILLVDRTDDVKLWTREEEECFLLKRCLGQYNQKPPSLCSGQGWPCGAYRWASPSSVLLLCTLSVSMLAAWTTPSTVSPVLQEIRLVYESEHTHDNTVNGVCVCVHACMCVCVCVMSASARWILYWCKNLQSNFLTCLYVRNKLSPLLWSQNAAAWKVEQGCWWYA